MSHINTTPTAGKLALPSSVYDIAKNVTTIYLPALASLYVGLAGLYGWPYADKVTATVALVITFLGIVLKVSTNSYNKSVKSIDGVLEVDQSDPAKDKYLLDITTDLNAVAQSDRITLKVNNVTDGTSQN